MAVNPYREAIMRFSRTVAGVLAAIACFAADVFVLVTGRTSGISDFSHVYTRTHGASQFWFTVVLFALLGIGASWFAWISYRE